MTTNARDEKWSEWIEWSGGSAPIDPTVFVEIKTRDGDIEYGEAVAFYWLHDREPSDIIAYRYKIKDPGSESMKRGKTEAETLALNGWKVGDILEGDEGNGPDRILITAIGEDRFTCKWDYKCTGEYERERGNTTLRCREWRKVGFRAGLDHLEFTEAEEEAWQAKERGIDVPDPEADNVNKPKHYQLREGYEVYDLRQDLAAKAANGGATYDQYSDWDRAIEYIVRMWGKNRLEDAKKGRWYLDKLIGKLEAQE